MASDDKLPSIDKLNNSIRSIWKLQMTVYLQAKEHWRLVNGSANRPENGAENQGMLARSIVGKARVNSNLLQTISSSQLHIIARSELVFPSQKSNELAKTFDRASLPHKLQLLSQLLDLKMRSHQTVDAYFKDLKGITERLDAITLAVSADLQIAALLRGLPPEYEKLCTTYVQYPTKVLGHFALFAVCNKLSFPSSPETMLVFWRSTCDNGKISRARQLQMYHKRINIVLGGRGVHVCSNYDNM